MGIHTGLLHKEWVDFGVPGLLNLLQEGRLCIWVLAWTKVTTSSPQRTPVRAEEDWLMGASATVKGYAGVMAVFQIIGFPPNIPAFSGRDVMPGIQKMTVSSVPQNSMVRKGTHSSWTPGCFALVAQHTTLTRLWETAPFLQGSCVWHWLIALDTQIS